MLCRLVDLGSDGLDVRLRAGQQLTEDTARRPNVDSVVVVFAPQKYLWRTVVPGLDVWREAAFLILNFLFGVLLHLHGTFL